MTADVADALPYGVRDLKLTQYTDALGTVLGTVSVDLPYIQTLNFTEAEEFAELRGDDKLITTRGKGSMVNWDLESGGIATAPWAVITGGSVILSGVTPNRIVELQKKSTTARPWFRIDGKIISDSGGDVLVRIYRCRANGDIKADFADGTFTTSNITGVGYPLLDDANDLLYSIFRRETSAELTLTPDPNPVAAPLNLAAGTVTSTGVSLTWTPVANADHYLVEKSSDGGTTWSSAGANPTVANLAVTGLTTATAYKFRVSSISGAEQSQPSLPISVTTA